ncbi:MAG: hypothetical protein BGN88_08315 [Clostridiales bacterium 43-6]|nr:MAG: hypothetical protein BGN88_08315 [Clostridiales bacterium 43-6]
MNKQMLKKILAVLIFLSFVCVMILSTGFLMTHQTHICTGSGCPTCQFIQEAAGLLSALSKTPMAFCLVFFSIVTGLVLSFYPLHMLFSSLTGLKIRMNN